MKHYFHNRYDKLIYNEPTIYIYTWFLIILLILIYGFEIYYLKDSLQKYMIFTTDIFSFSFMYTLLTSIFLHLNLVHLLSNLLGLYLFGRLVERHIGIGVIFVFLIGGIFANIVSSLISFFFRDLFYSLGASGGIASLIILGILFEPLKLTTIFGWFLIYMDIIGVGKVSTTNHLAHIGGYLALIILFFFLNLRNRQKVIKGLIINFISFSILSYLIFFTTIFSIL